VKVNFEKKPMRWLCGAVRSHLARKNAVENDVVKTFNEGACVTGGNGKRRNQGSGGTFGLSSYVRLFFCEGCCYGGSGEGFTVLVVNLKL
jgi:hypothetical protein